MKYQVNKFDQNVQCWKKIGSNYNTLKKAQAEVLKLKLGWDEAARIIEIPTLKIVDEFKTKK